MPIKSCCSMWVAMVIKSIKPNYWRLLSNSASVFVTRSEPWRGGVLQLRSCRQTKGSTKPPADGYWHEAVANWQLTSTRAATELGKKKWLLHGEGSPLLKMMRGFGRAAAICSEMLLSKHEMAKGSTTAEVRRTTATEEHSHHGKH